MGEKAQHLQRCSPLSLHDPGLSLRSSPRAIKNESHFGDVANECSIHGTLWSISLEVREATATQGRYSWYFMVHQHYFTLYFFYNVQDILYI